MPVEEPGTTRHNPTPAGPKHGRPAAPVPGDAVSAASRRLRVSGTVELLCTIFGPRLERGCSRGPHNATTTYRRAERAGGTGWGGHRRAGPGWQAIGPGQFPVASEAGESAGYTPREPGIIYGSAAAAVGRGQGFAVIEGGGCFDRVDPDAYVTSLGIIGPVVTAVAVD